jgi:hypothetical protein
MTTAEQAWLAVEVLAVLFVYVRYGVPAVRNVLAARRRVRAARADYRRWLSAMSKDKPCP